MDGIREPYASRTRTGNVMDMSEQTSIIPVALNDGKQILLEVRERDAETDVAFRAPSFRGLTDAIEGIASDVFSGLQEARPSRATVEFGLEVAIDSGQLTALVLKGAAKANFRVTLEWDRSKDRDEDG